MRDSSCSTESGSRLCTVALIICRFIRLYLCRARWCLCSTPFSCRSHRSCGGRCAVLGPQREGTRSRPPRGSQQVKGSTGRRLRNRHRLPSPEPLPPRRSHSSPSRLRKGSGTHSLPPCPGSVHGTERLGARPRVQPRRVAVPVGTTNQNHTEDGACPQRRCQSAGTAPDLGLSRSPVSERRAPPAAQRPVSKRKLHGHFPAALK